MDDEVLLEAREGGVLILTLNRPDAMNTLQPKLMTDLTEALARAAEDREVGCVVLTGAGKAFCAGADVTVVNKANERRSQQPVLDPDAVEKRMARIRQSGEAARLLHEMDKPTIAMINGACAGAGLALAGACDLRFAAASAVFASAYVKFGVPGDYGGAYFWTRILGTAKARELYLLGEKMTAEEALAFGLLTRVTSDEALREITLTLARTIAGDTRAAYAYAKRNLNLAEMGALKDVLDLDAMTTVLAREAVTRARKAKAAAATQGEPSA
jgi:2-(1,2-epoxy-1,2-dihydrophenyl)acetyl-CoA isomerase